MDSKHSLPSQSEGKFKLIVDSFGKDRFKIDEPLKDYTALNIGGPVKLFFIAFKTNELIKIISMARQLNLPFFLFGTGSKIMISDRGVEGLVIKNMTKNIRTISVKGKVSKHGLGVEEALVEVDSGVSLSKFSGYLDSQDLSSQDFINLAGSVGGNLFMSQLLQNLVKSIKVLDSDSDIDEISTFELNLKKHIILSAVFRIKSK